MANTLFKVGDKVVHKTDPTYTGIVTKVRNVQEKGLKGKAYQWLYLDNSTIPSGFTSEFWKLQ